MTTTVYSLEAKQIIHEIIEDMRAGDLSVDIPDFPSIHNELDANEYFLQCTDIFDDAFDEVAFKVADAVAEEVTWWLQHSGTTLRERIAAKPLI